MPKDETPALPGHLGIVLRKQLVPLDRATAAIARLLSLAAEESAINKEKLLASDADDWA